jgi:hypothetical protein
MVPPSADVFVSADALCPVVEPVLALHAESARKTDEAPRIRSVRAMDE